MFLINLGVVSTMHSRDWKNQKRLYLTSRVSLMTAKQSCHLWLVYKLYSVGVQKMHVEWREEIMKFPVTNSARLVGL